jgi:hypothetical protein
VEEFVDGVVAALLPVFSWSLQEVDLFTGVIKAEIWCLWHLVDDAIQNIAIGLGIIRKIELPKTGELCYILLVVF